MTYALTQAKVNHPDLHSAYLRLKKEAQVKGKIQSSLYQTSSTRWWCGSSLETPAAFHPLDQAGFSNYHKWQGGHLLIGSLARLRGEKALPSPVWWSISLVSHLQGAPQSTVSGKRPLSNSMQAFPLRATPRWLKPLPTPCCPFCWKEITITPNQSWNGWLKSRDLGVDFTRPRYSALLLPLSPGHL